MIGLDLLCNAIVLFKSSFGIGLTIIFFYFLFFLFLLLVFLDQYIILLPPSVPIILSFYTFFLWDIVLITWILSGWLHVMRPLMIQNISLCFYIVFFIPVVVMILLLLLLLIILYNWFFMVWSFILILVSIIRWPSV